ncbi:DUF2529 family protein [Priestia megaterium]|uniref:DUF2529 family protein n=1 Tax=Priestia megaterium TaxID=1404 RepID=UPI0013E3074E|nr:DUF2529 family protein [Priestia megaterium]MED3861783.1 DUF2529 family protein [Priestia megaterium]MED4102537.1 DUF2529 family protein [Priestia megaterium]MED4142311.1 DUF2529 family protein [Priestia megaterium]MED4168427.1 DUF2529 family protein [Priestia megaterium]MED4201054.1 DUF2529 family protein [Priestia megaterium]
MLKIFTTQLSGFFKRIEEQEEFQFEDAARILAQASVGEGFIYIYGVEEMHAITLEALSSAEPLSQAKAFPLHELDQLTSVDRVLLVSRFSTDNKAVEIAEHLKKRDIPFVSIAAVPKEIAEPSLTALADAHIDTKLLKPLIPGEDGSRFGFPAMMVALYAYYGLTFTLKEIVEEYE